MTQPKPKKKKFTITLSVEEKKCLLELAADDELPAATFLKRLIRTKHKELKEQRRSELRAPN